MTILKALRSMLPALLVVLLAGWQDASFANYPPGIVLYTGRATVLRATAKVLTSTTKVLLADTGEMDSNGSTKDATVVTFDNPPPLEVHSKTARAITSGENNVSASNAAVEKLYIAVRGLIITADVIESDAYAECHQDSGTVSTHGSAIIANLRINGIPIAPGLQPNVTRTILGTVVVTTNEQTNPDVNTIVVNAVHIRIPLLLDVVISHTESGIFTCTPL